LVGMGFWAGCRRKSHEPAVRVYFPQFEEMCGTSVVLFSNRLLSRVSKIAQRCGHTNADGPSGTLSRAHQAVARCQAAPGPPRPIPSWAPVPEPRPTAPRPPTAAPSTPPGPARPGRRPRPGQHRGPSPPPAPGRSTPPATRRRPRPSGGLRSPPPPPRAPNLPPPRDRPEGAATGRVEDLPGPPPTAATDRGGARPLATECGGPLRREPPAGASPRGRAGRGRRCPGAPGSPARGRRR